MKPDFTAKSFTNTLFYKEQSDRENLMNGLHKAGLPS